MANWFLKFLNIFTPTAKNTTTYNNNYCQTNWMNSVMLNPFMGSFAMPNINNIFNMTSTIPQSNYTGTDSFQDIFNSSLQLSYKEAGGKNKVTTTETQEVKTSKSSSSAKVSVSNPKDISDWEKMGYSREKGIKLAQIAKDKIANDFTGHCAKYVKTALKSAGLAPYYDGHAYQMVENLAGNKNFKRISPDQVDLKKLPAGCILVYDKGVEGYSKEYGHVEITSGTGTAISDYITFNLHRKPTAIYMPVA